MTWDDLIHDALTKPYFKQLVAFLKEEDKMYTIFPPKEKRMSCFKLTPFEKVKVVIIGQDPYHNIGQAHGLAFSVESGKYPPSLVNIYKELVDDLKITYPSTGNLSAWAKEGVLLLNTLLTVRAHEPLSHKDQGWEILTESVIKALNDHDHICYMLWGAHAQKLSKLIDTKKHTILKAPHPSPLSAHRGFFGSKPFSNINQDLITHGIKPINWSLT